MRNSTMLVLALMMANGRTNWDEGLIAAWGLGRYLVLGYIVVVGVRGGGGEEEEERLLEHNIMFFKCAYERLKGNGVSVGGGMDERLRC